MRRAKQFRRRRLALQVGWACLAIGAAQQAAAQASTGSLDAADLGGADPAATAEAAEDTGLFGSGLRIPPVLFSGAVSYDLRMGRGPGDLRNTEHLVTTSVNGGSYLYQPWFARISGSLGLTVSRSQSSGDPSGPVSQPTSSDRFVTGGVRLDLFPRSRFPFEIHYEVADSRVDTGSPGTFDFRTHTFGASQKYRPVDGRYNISASAERRIFDNADSRDTLDALLADFSTRWKHNELSVGGSLSRGERDRTDETTLFRTVVGRHHYAAGSEFSLDTTLNWSDTEDNLSTFATDLHLLQWSTIGVWNPEGRPWTLSGSVRALAVDDKAGGNNSETYGATLGGNYQVNDNLRLTAHGSFTGLHAGGDVSETTVASAGASYQGDTLEIGEFRYDWFGSGSLSASQTGEESQRSLSGQVGHTLSRSWTLGEQSALGMNLGQSLNTTRTQQDPEPEIPGVPTTTRLLVHNAALSWNAGSADRNAFARASYSDSAEIGGARARFQLLNLQGSGTLQLDRNQSVTGDLTMQWTRQRTGDFFDAGLGQVVVSQPATNASAGGEISYRHMRVFNVPRLRFSSKLRLTQDVQDQPGILATIPDRETRLWENRLDWNVGRLESQLVLRISWIDGERRSLLMWRVQRTFGN